MYCYFWLAGEIEEQTDGIVKKEIGSLRGGEFVFVVGQRQWAWQGLWWWHLTNTMGPSGVKSNLLRGSHRCLSLLEGILATSRACLARCFLTNSLGLPAGSPEGCLLHALPCPFLLQPLMPSVPHRLKNDAWECTTLKVIVLSYGEGGKICYCMRNSGKGTRHLGLRTSFRSLRKKLLKLKRKWFIAGNLLGLECFAQRIQPFRIGCIHKRILQRVDALPLFHSLDNWSAAYLESQSFPQRCIEVALKNGHSCHDHSQEGWRWTQNKKIQF